MNEDTLDGSSRHPLFIEFYASLTFQNVSSQCENTICSSEDTVRTKMFCQHFSAKQSDSQI